MNKSYINNKPRLVLLTARYPYQHGEEFLEAELPFLEKEFHIDIVPTLTDFELTQRRNLPSTVVIRKDLNIKLREMRRLANIKYLSYAKNYIEHEIPYLPPKWKALRSMLKYAYRSASLQHVLIDAYNEDNIAVFYSYWLTTGALALAEWKNQGLNSRAIARVHGGDLYHDRNPTHYLPAQVYAIQHLDRIIGISQHGVKYLKKLYPQQSHKIELSRLGIPAAPKTNQFPNDGHLHLVSCSYLTEVKRISLLIKALERSKLPIVWTHLGGGKLETKLKTQAKALPSNITWRVTGILPHDEVTKFYKDNYADLFINVSSSEGVPVSIMEALSYGIPVAATNVGGTSEIVFHNYNGFLLRHDISPTEIASILSHYYDLPVEIKKRLRRNAWLTWKTRVNAEKQYSSFVQSLLSCIQQ